MTQWISLVLGLLIIMLTIRWRNSYSFRSIYPALLFVGFHAFFYYLLLYLFRSWGYDTSLNLYPFPWFSFQAWSPVLTIHSLISIVIIMAFRYMDDEKQKQIERETLRTLTEKVNGDT